MTNEQMLSIWRRQVREYRREMMKYKVYSRGIKHKCKPKKYKVIKECPECEGKVVSLGIGKYFCLDDKCLWDNLEETQ
tara:strand:+ start:243 stop:476 length:234 start_codon:yes stop_codon:yes gene_type:complete